MKTSFILIDPAQEALFFRGGYSGNRFFFPHVKRKKVFFSRKHIKGLNQKTLLPQISALWNALSPTEQTAWNDAGAVMGRVGFRLFVDDTSIRLHNSISGVATPSLFHQSWVGALHVESPASEIQIAQLHPSSYYVDAPVPGKKGMRTPVFVSEAFSLPLEISLSYKGALTPSGAEPFAVYQGIVWSSYQAVDEFNTVTIPLDLSSDWQTASNSISSIRGTVIGYSLAIHIHDCTGDLYFDNIKATHSGQNWVRDTYCRDIDQNFTKAFSQIPKNWVAEILPDGAGFSSVYQDFSN